MTTPVCFDLRDGAMLVEFPGLSDEDANRAAIALAPLARRVEGVEDAVPAACSVLLVYDASRVERGAVSAAVERAALATGARAEDGRSLRLPVVYDGEDLSDLASRAGVSAAELARRHAAGRYRVAFVGFAPGFAYLGGLPADLAAPRLTRPRPRVPPGSVAIGGAWTGVYPAASPGGWRLLGRTSAVLFDPGASPPALLAPGDRVEFEAVSRLPESRPATPTPPPSGRPVLRVVSPGLFTSIQASPRHGRGSFGVPAGGAMDTLGLASANVLVGNAPGAAALEITLAGPEFEVLADAVLSGRGAVRAGERVRIGPIERGARSYLAVSGGFVDPMGIGQQTRRLVAGDVLSMGAGPAAAVQTLPAVLEISDDILLRVVLGPEGRRFAPSQVERFLEAAWRVTPESDRRGLRLEGAPLEHAGEPEIAPSGTVPGTVQVPGNGQPIVLGPDGPVTGGYPRLATVIGADLWRLGQARPGARLRFSEVSFREAVSVGRAAGSTISFP